VLKNHVFFKVNPSRERSPRVKDRSDIGCCGYQAQRMAWVKRFVLKSPTLLNTFKIIVFVTYLSADFRQIGIQPLAR